MTLYLKEEIVRQTLNTITSISPKGSIISFDYYSKSVVIGEGSWILKPGIKGLKTTGEEFSFGIDMSGDAREKALTHYTNSSIFSYKSTGISGLRHILLPR